MPGGRHRLTIPIRDSRQQIRYTRVAGEHYREIHLRTIEQAYAKAPHLDEVMPLLRTVIGYGSRLGDVTNLGSCTLLWKLRPDAKIVADSSVVPILDRSRLSGSSWMIALAEAVAADRYLVGQTALANYLDTDMFDQHGIELVPHHYEPQPYPQLHGDFEPNLSVIDLLMNVGAEGARELLRV